MIDFRKCWKFFSSISIPITMHLLRSLKAMIPFLLQHSCKTKTLHLGVKMELFSSNWFNRIYKLSGLQKTYSWKNTRMTVQHEKSATRRKRNMKRVQHMKKQHENSATRKKSSMKIVQCGKRATWKECNIESVLYEKSVTWKECNTKQVQHVNSRIWKECNTEKV